jgi:peptidoglycan hydrolase-like protein with peptidoglycan-binding domain
MTHRTAAVLLVALTLGLLAGPPAQAKTPGSFTGYAFDACHTPSQSDMDVWLERSPYWGVGVYIAGDNRACPDEQSLNLTPAWVQSQTRKGWRILPLTVGLQASCFKPGEDYARVSADDTDDYAAARSQGVAEANSTVVASRGLGIAKGSTQWLDVEHFDITKPKCKESALAFISSWTRRLHALGYKSGFYSSASSGIAILDEARKSGASNLPDQLWIGEWNVVSNTDSGYISDEGWRQQRVHQYRGGHDETYAGVTLNIDSNWMDVGKGSRAPRPAGHCRVVIDFPSYGGLHRGSRGPKVKALQCLLRQRHLLHGKLTERYDRRTVRAVKRFQHRNPPLTANGKTSKHTWVALLSQGSSPFMKIGSASNAVRRLQRALNAATPSKLEATGVYDKKTAKAVKRYQKARKLPPSGVTTDEVWTQLFDGRR